MPKMFSERDLEAFERLRRAFDPDGIANPGKVIPTPRLCGEVPGPLPAASTGADRALPSVSEPRAGVERGARRRGAAEGRSRPDRRRPRRRPGSTASSSTSRATSPAPSRPASASRRSRPRSPRPGQRLSLDPPGDPTIGACLAANLSGPLRHRFGAPRDLVLGVTLVLADGTIVNAGGKVVKNVAGYDLGKLVCGSRGPARVHRRGSASASTPIPSTAATVVVETDDPAPVVAALLASQLVAERARHPPSRPRRGAVRGRRGRGRRQVAADARARRRRGGRRRASGTSRARSRAPRSGGRRFVPGELAGVPRRARRRRSSARRPASRTSRTPSPRRPPEPVRAAAGAGARALRPDRSARVTTAPDVLRSLTSDCVHCGFCLPTCPTYLLWSEEMDSPRGRIQLMEAHLDGTISLNPTVVEHFDRCLGCMACVTACPSGVAVRQADRGDARDGRDARRAPARRPVRARRAVQAAPLSAADGAGAAARAARPQAAAAGPPRRDDRDRAALALDRAAGAAYARGSARPAGVSAFSQVASSPWCSASVNAATARVLAADGYEVVAPPQGCCGALSMHAGRGDEGRAFARQADRGASRASRRSSSTPPAAART